MKPRIPTKSTMGLSLAATVAMTVLIQPWEGRAYVPYQDVGEVWTVCDGITGKDVIPGKTYTDAECDELLKKAVTKHEAAMKKLIRRDTPEMVEAAVISFTYNLGPQKLATSTLLRKLNTGDFKGACDELPRWNKVNGVVYRGLVNRRDLGDENRYSERQICYLGL